MNLDREAEKMQEKEESLLRNRVMELARQSEWRGIPSYTDFLNLYEQNIVYSMEKQLGSISLQANGGYELAERKVIGLYGRDLYMEEHIPITVIKVEVKNSKFCDTLTHRDYLGAILNLGIERSKVGDILVDFPDAYVFCKEEISEFIITNLEKVKHTQVILKDTTGEELSIQPKYKVITTTVSSIRLDTLLAAVFQGSRSSLTGYVTGEKVFVNGKMISSNSYSLREGDVVSVRGMGKFRFREVKGQTKKGRISVILEKFV